MLELKHTDDIQTFFELNTLDDISDEDELDGYISELSKLGKEYRDVHTELSSGLGNEYKTQFPDELNQRRNVNQSIQDAKKKLRQRKKDNAKPKLSEKENDLLSEKQFLLQQVTEFSEKITQNLPHEMDDLRHLICFSESQLADLQRLRFKILNSLKDSTLHQTEISDTEVKVKENIARLKDKQSDLKKKLADERQESLKDEIAKEKMDHEAVLEEQSLKFDHLFKEIEIRCDAFEYKVDVKSIPTLTNHQLMDAEKRLFDIDKDFSEILDKITYFAGKSSSEISKEKVLKIEVKRDSMTTSKKEYFKSVKDEIRERDISEEKLKNALSLNFELPKFSGYDSQLDIFSFKKEFRKLVEPYISKIHWADSLKWKYLTGQALTLVESLTDVEKIWKKLEETFGDVQLLLQNKLISLGKCENLSEIKSDEKRITSISSILNGMSELSTLAKTHKIENELFFGGGVEQVLSLMGNERKRKFIRKSDHKLKGPQAWIKIQEMLQKELVECEKLALYEKSEMLLKAKECKTSHFNDDFEGQITTTAHSANIVNGVPCHLCEKTDHVLTVRGDNTFVQYFACKSFVEKNCEERLKLLEEKNFCVRCLRPGWKKGHGGICYRGYLCPDTSHDASNKVHILLCKEHCGNENNKNLLKKYRTEIMESLVPNMESFSREIKICNFSDSGDSSVYSSESSGSNDEKRFPEGRGIFKLQTIKIGGHSFNLFFDDGCGEMVIKKEAAEILKSLGLAKLIDPGPRILVGAGGVKTLVEHGEWEIRLPLTVPTKDGETHAVLSGLCLDKVTTEFPHFQMNDAMKDVKIEWDKINKDTPLPKVPKSVGGDTDIMVGVQFLKYFPKKTF